LDEQFIKAISLLWHSVDLDHEFISFPAFNTLSSFICTTSTGWVTIAT